MENGNLCRIFITLLLLQGGYGIAQNSLIEKVESSWKSFSICKYSVLKDAELAPDIYQNDRTSAAKTEAYLRNYSVSKFGKVDADKLEGGGHLWSVLVVYQPDNKTYNQRSLSERREQLKYCRGLFEHFANESDR
jgi:hypothetical protein